MLTKNFVDISLTAINTAINEMHLPQEEILREQRKLFQKELPKTKFPLEFHNLRIPKIYDLHSYSLFKAISKYLKNSNEKLKFTQIVGREIYLHIKLLNKLKESNSEDLTNLKKNLLKIIKFLEKSGYVQKARIDWKYFNRKDWKNEGKTHLIYFMKNPVILPSAQRLFKEEGFGQHFSTRTMEYALLKNGIFGREDKKFDPNKFNIKSVAEVWNLKKI